MAVVALQRTARGGSTWTAHVFWAGDSRAYVVTADGVAQLTTDDLRDPGDALANLRRDSVVSNAMSADTDFHVSYRRVSCDAPFLLVGATDGCFGYVPTPMHFEHLLLRALAGARSTQAWSTALQIGHQCGHRRRRRHGGDGRRHRLQGFPGPARPPAGRAGTHDHRAAGRTALGRSRTPNGRCSRPGSGTRTRRPACGAQYQIGYERHLRAAADDLDDEAEPLTEDASPDDGARAD